MSEEVSIPRRYAKNLTKAKEICRYNGGFNPS